MTKQQTEPQGQVPNIWDRLAEPFPPEELEWKIQRSGKTQGGKYWAQIVAYVQSRAIMQRLDDVVGPANWQDEYISSPCGSGYMCLLSIRHPERPDEWIVKADGADRTKFEPTKGGFSNSLKRAAVKFGMGRHLYDMPVAWADIGPDRLSKEQKDSGIWQRGSVTIKDEKGKERKEWFNWAVPEAQRTGKTKEKVKEERKKELDKERKPVTKEQLELLKQWAEDSRIGSEFMIVGEKASKPALPIIKSVLLDHKGVTFEAVRGVLDYLAEHLVQPHPPPKDAGVDSGDIPGFQEPRMGDGATHPAELEQDDEISF